ncbi:predicted protein [Aspergillus nidulans FGSC A4]|uniref:F-box domain protein (AFU_orthologue AFUA_1G02120) n=1 Tax=Emericella nidulans (strain FGSC A4 / ATCC 38163 / CBS 112.46 / NRRL 194 / M139) TaxID=227321 RepID=Q5BGH7_EMENI|nr:hypothetical protein [Aspergillus nidulans FGSC A4]EAA65759.1 predicted protein [Aspergillus nidulans FGSC A4]CBF89659.1 TPA: F-box domain protein (AFU_orthologue; AFUA_1G02120) [Aspergillus nidulans FGSC A4]|eukprot:XP_657957.1 predicted protein [Aspergillus nidulans FGSC A4]
MPGVVNPLIYDTDFDAQSTNVIHPSVAERCSESVAETSCWPLRLAPNPWAQAIDEALPLQRAPANTLPPEILTQIFYELSPRDFDNARRVCSQWMRASLNERLLESMLKRAGWWDSWLRDNKNQRRKMNVERTGFVTTTVVDFSQLSQAGQTSTSRDLSYPYPSSKDVSFTSGFHVSNCGNNLLVISGCNIHIYQLLGRRRVGSAPMSKEDLGNVDIAPVASITCPTEVLSATIDTSTSNFNVAALLRNRLGTICELAPVDRGGNFSSMDFVHNGTNSCCARGRHSASAFSKKITSRHFFYDVCSVHDPPLSISICPGYRCVAFGSESGIELRWVDQETNIDCRKYLPMSQPSEILHFMPNRLDTPLEFRLISSVAGPGVEGCRCQTLSAGELHPSCPFHTVKEDVQTFSRWAPERKDQVGLVRTTQCHHYRAVPVNDGIHLLFVEPRSGYLCIGSNAPLDGPTCLTRALVCVPPFKNDTPNGSQDAPVPTVFASGSDLSWGLRIVAAYGNRLVFYSVPLDVFNVLKNERERQGDGVMADSDLARDFFLIQSDRPHRESLTSNQNEDWEFLLSVSYRPTAMMWPFKIYGKEIGRVQNVVEIALQSSHGCARIWVFSASGETNIIDVDTFTSASQDASKFPCKSFTIGSDGRIVDAQLVSRSEHCLVTPGNLRERKKTKSRAGFSGRHMLCRYSSSMSDGGRDATAANVFDAQIVNVSIPELGGRHAQPEVVY